MISAPFRLLGQFYASSIGKKIIVALTGIVLLGFLAGHLAGNLLVFLGPDAMNGYALSLQTMLFGTGVWIARTGLLTAFLLHVIATIHLAKQNRERNTRYAYKAVVQTTLSARLMIWSGLTILAFLIFHLLHYTIRIIKDFDGPNYQTTLADGTPAHNVHKMMIDGFSSLPVSLFYILALTLLCSHLSHGFSSIFQTLGLRSRKTSAIIHKLGWTFALVIYLGFISIPIAVLTGFLSH